MIKIHDKCHITSSTPTETRKGQTANPDSHVGTTREFQGNLKRDKKISGAERNESVRGSQPVGRRRNGKNRGPVGTLDVVDTGH